MPYRGDVHALETRRSALEKELADVRLRARELADVQESEATLANELASVERMLGDIAPARRSLPMLDDVRIAAPCKASWDDMVADGPNPAVRFCGQCQKNVYNLSDMNKADAERVLREKEGTLCARVYRREDGTVITADCPVGVRRRRVRRAAFTAIGGGLLAFAGVMLVRPSTARMGSVAVAGQVQMGEPTMGDVDPIPPETVAPTGPTPTAVMGVVAPVPRPPPPDAKKSVDVAKPKPRAR